MKIGVELRLGGDPGELFADARALESAGADSLWVAGAGDEPHVLLGALAAVTWRVRLVAVDLGPSAGAQTTLARISRGRVFDAVSEGERIRLAAGDGEPERWIRSEFPPGRVAWKELLAKHEAEGTAGLLLTNDPRLLDLLRNADVQEDRSDIRLAFG
jgi:hypothetical protein